MAQSLSPCPTALRTVLRADADITQVRNVHCTHYAGCIDVVVKKGWPSFTCAACPLFKETAPPHASDHAFDQPVDRSTP